MFAKLFTPNFVTDDHKLNEQKVKQPRKVMLELIIGKKKKPTDPKPWASF
jgi:hypothetical protein